MQHTFHEKPSNCVTILLGLIFSLVMLALSPWYLQSVKGPPIQAWIAFIFMGGFFGSMSLLLLLALLRIRRHMLILENDRITQRAIFRQCSFHLSETNKAEWRGGIERKIRLCSDVDKCTIHLNQYQPDDEWNIARFLRASLPEEVQHDWEKYCHSLISLQHRRDLLEREKQVSLGPPGEFYYLRTRKKLDQIFLAVFLLTVVAFTGLCWLVGGVVGLQEIFLLRARGMLIVLLLSISILAILWLVLRSGIPEEGIYVKYYPGEIAFMYSALFPILGGLGGYHLINYLAGEWAYKQWLQLTIALVSFTPFLLVGHRLDKQREKERMREDEAIAEWEKLNPPSASNEIQ